MSKHGGSPESGLVQPIGLMALRPVNEGGAIIEAPETVTAREEAAKRRERALHFERRRLALELLSASIEADPDRPNPGDFSPDEQKEFAALNTKRVLARVDMALSYADVLIGSTGGVI